MLRKAGIAPLTQDRVLAPDIEQVAQLIHSRQIADAVELALQERDRSTGKEEQL